MSSAIRNKTVRRPLQDVSGTDTSFGVNAELDRILNVDVAEQYKRPWHRLDRGLRLNRLRQFAENLATKRGFQESEKQALVTLLTKALDKKMLNSKTAVEYDQEAEEIKEIKPLVMHQSSTGEVLFQLLEKRNAVTFRKRGSATSAEAQRGSAVAQAGGEA
jgi:hypothetical protein